MKTRNLVVIAFWAVVAAVIAFGCVCGDSEQDPEDNNGDDAWHGGGDDANGDSDPLDGPFAKLVAHEFHTCGLREDTGEVICWGDQLDNPLGMADSESGSFVDVAAAREFSCALDDQGDHICWGRIGREDAAVHSGEYAPYQEIAALDAGMCAVDEDELIYCDFSTSESPPLDIDSYQQISSGSRHICAIDGDGTAHCDGLDDDGQSDVVDGTYVEISAGARHTCAVDDGGEVVCWGANESGQLDAPDGPFVDVAAGGRFNNEGKGFACALDTDGEVVCWGELHEDWEDWDAYGYPSGPLTDVVAGSHHACALDEDKSAICWGYNGSWQSGCGPGMFCPQPWDD